MCLSASCSLYQGLRATRSGKVFDDRDGYSTGAEKTVKEGTATGEYKYNNHIHPNSCVFGMDLATVLFGR
jgi:hypothetical protein